MILHYIIIDKQTGKQVGKPYKNGAQASRRVDKLDNQYGAYRYIRKAIYHDKERL